MSFFFGLPVAPGPVVRQNSPVGGGGVYFPRFLNRTMLAQQLYRNFVGRPFGLDQTNIPLSSFFLTPNEFDLCIARDWDLFDRIDRQALSCGRKPDCFNKPELAWVETPPGGIVFNPVGAIPLPDPGTENVVVVRFRVPIGYDGIITAQFNQYSSPWNEGSGDLVWRVRANGRYLRDCGNIQFTLGSSIELSPIYGGLQLRSGNLVEYVVSAPNSGGSLPFPGIGNVIAGLHGWFWPRI